MRQLPTKPTVTPPGSQRMAEFRLRVVNEIHQIILSVVFFAAAFTIVCLLKVTVITLLLASRWLAVFGLIGFLMLFAIRKRFGLSLLDGLYYSVFGIAPGAMAVFLALNASCTDTYTETHPITGFYSEGSGYTYQLADSAYQKYWRIRNMETLPNSRTSAVVLTVCDGVFGYKVVKEKEVL